MDNVVINGVRYVPAKEPVDGSAFDVLFQCDDLDCELTVKEYLIKLLSTLWSEQCDFSGKRPFGNSCWDIDLMRALVDSGHIKGKVLRKYDDDGYMIEIDDRYDHTEAWEFVANLIKQL